MPLAPLDVVTGRIVVPVCLVAALVGLARGEVPAQQPAQEILNAKANSPADVLDADAFPTEPWAIAIKKGDSQAAISAFVRALREGPPRNELENEVPRILRRWLGWRVGFVDGARLEADLVAQKHFIGVYGIEHQFEGEIDWAFDASRKPGNFATREWQAQLGRHTHWVNLADAYAKTKDPKYAKAWESELRSWLRQCPRPENGEKKLMNFWRTIDAGIRSGWSWPHAFEVFRKSPDVSDEALWLLVCGMREHGVHLAKNKGPRNWFIMETNGLGHVGLMFPELRDAKLFADSALGRVRAIMEGQFYPDGCHYELSPGYAMGTGIAQIYSLAQLAKLHKRSLTEKDTQSLLDGAEGLSRIADPDGFCPPLHDSGTIDIKTMQGELASAMDPKRFQQPAWKSAVSELRPWGGYSIFRRADRFAIHDAGPWGAGHQHDDTQQFMAYAHGRWFLVDTGKPRYNADPISGYIRSATGHNVVLCDSKTHREYQPLKSIDKPLPMAFAEKDGLVISSAKRQLAAWPGSEPSAPAFSFERTVVDVPQLGWLVVDRLSPADDKPHSWEWLWHLKVDKAELLADGSAVASFEGGPMMNCLSTSTRPLRGEISKGQTTPVMRGWHTSSEGSPQPLSVLRLMSEAAAGPVVTATVFSPARDQASQIPLRKLSVKQDGALIKVDVVAGQSTHQFEFSGENEIDLVRHIAADKRTEIQLTPHSR